MHGLMNSHAQLSRLALHAQNNYSVMYDLDIAICSLAQTEGGKPIEWMTKMTNQKWCHS